MSVKYLTDVHDYHLARLVSLTLDPNDEWVKHDYTIGLDHLGRHTPIAYLHPEDQPKLADHIRSLCNRSYPLSLQYACRSPQEVRESRLCCKSQG